MTHVITEPCIGVKDASCVDACPVDCIYGRDDPDAEMLLIHPEECIDCGLCIDACPVLAIFPASEVPARWRSYIGRNYARFGLLPPAGE
jgi:NAD-dependent dihydropyrimidine dehydrogenase PreA subunit